jgi:hypothetical protein
MRELGDSYIKSEFRLHKTTKKKEQVELFFVEWEMYREQINMTARAIDSLSSGSLDDKGAGGASTVFEYGRNLPADAELSVEQREQLEKLREEAIKSAGKR